MARSRLRVPGRGVAASPPVRAGLLAASANVAATFARGLLPRSVGDQALVTGATTAVIFQAAATVHAAAETIALRLTGSHGMRGRTPSRPATVAADGALALSGLALTRGLPTRPDETLALSVTRTVGDFLLVGGFAGAISEIADWPIRLLLPRGEGNKRSMTVDVVIGTGIAATMVHFRHQRAREYGLVEPKRQAVKRAGLKAITKAVGIGLASSAALTVLATGEQWIANGVRELLDTRLRRFDVASPLVGHTVALVILGSAGLEVYSLVKHRVESRGDIVEPAYAKPSLNPHVSTGPGSTVKFDQIGKEGRRFVLMALSAEEITTVMSEPAKNPVRVIGPYDPHAPAEERAAACLREMDAVGAFDRSLICIASPTGVGYVSYTFAESLEYLARGDCAIVVPEYALVPSFLALFDTHDGAVLQHRVIELTRDRIASMPAGSRPRLVQFGESLGAQVALDVAAQHGSIEFDKLGLDAGLYFGVPFRSKSWNEWRRTKRQFDPKGSMVALSEPGHVALLPAEEREAAHHFMIIHYDDPVNKFSYRLAVRQPWWMGAPTTRPPKVPRETIWRPVITFALTLIDLKNGMDFKPGEFHRRGHDYRIDSRAATALAYGLRCTDEQAAGIEHALREREEEWATRRLIARKFTAARESVLRTLRSWGVKPPPLPEAGESTPMFEVAEVNPHSPSLMHRLDSSVMS